MLPAAPLLLEPLENPPPYPPPLALAKDTVGTPIREITIIAAMSFVVFKISFLSIDVADQSSGAILAEAVQENLIFEASGFYVVMCGRRTRLFQFSIHLFKGVAKAARYYAHSFFDARRAGHARRARGAKRGGPGRFPTVRVLPSPLRAG